MKKSKLNAIISSIIAVTFAAIFCISCAKPTLQEGEIAGFALPHANVMAHTGSREYDSNLNMESAPSDFSVEITYLHKSSKVASFTVSKQKFTIVK